MIEDRFLCIGIPIKSHNAGFDDSFEISQVHENGHIPQERLSERDRRISFSNFRINTTRGRRISDKVGRGNRASIRLNRKILRVAEDVVQGRGTGITLHLDFSSHCDGSIQYLCMQQIRL